MIKVILKKQTSAWLFPLLMFWSLMGWAQTPVPPLTESEAISKARQFYDTKGEWAGKFTITKVRKVRFEKQSDTQVVAHIMYQAAFLRDMSKTVEDQRTFGYEYNNGWKATWMGGHKSARF